MTEFRSPEYMVKALQEIENMMETVAFSDSAGWLDIEKRINVLMECFHPEYESQIELISRCAGIAKNISASPGAGSMSLIEEAGECLRAAVEAVERDLENDSTAPPSEEKPAFEAGGEDKGLNDIAVSLLQLEPGDTGGIEDLVVRFRSLTGDEGTPGPFKSAAEQALRLINDFRESGGPDDWDVVVSALGDLLENMMNGRPDSGLPDEPGTSGDLGQAEAADGGTVSPDRALMPEDADPELMAEFVTEGNDLISQAEEALLILETDPENTDAVGTVFRAFHTVKGTAAFLDLSLIAEMGHYAESLLSRVRDKEIRYSGGYADLALQALDMIKEMVRSVTAAVSEGVFNKPEGYDALLKVLADPEAAGVSEESDDVAASSLRLGDILVGSGKAQRENVEKLAEGGDPGAGPLGLKIVRSDAASMSDVAKALRMQQRMSGPQMMDTTIRVSTERLDRLIDLVGELVVAHSMVSQDGAVIGDNNYSLQKKVAHTSKIVRELQDMGMSMRMIPLKATFQKMSRLVRDVSRKVGKTVVLKTEGEDTEIDRNMVDVIKDPLVHMVRNAVDHGIENSEERVRLGKPAHGTILLSAYHSAGSVVVEIRDDGKGLDREKILAKARRQGIIEDGASMSDREVFNLVLEPGFSTAETVTDVSGRGVGMDVVKKNIEGLRGQLEISSEPGSGSIFKMSLPLTLAIIDGMVIKVGSESYVIPTVSIIKSVKPGKDELSTVLTRGRMLSIQGRLIPLFRLKELFDISWEGRQNKEELVVVVEDEGRQAGLLIDELVGRQQIVIKSLGETMKHIPGISGGAIMPDGRVGLILDVGGIVKMASADQADQREITE